MVSIRIGSAAALQVDGAASGSLTVDGQPLAWDVASPGPGRYHVLHRGRSFEVEVVAADYASKAFSLKINGQRLELTAQTALDQLLERLGLSGATTQKINELKAPMPGLIVDVRVQPGQAVQKGDPLLVLEAMKMENILKAPTDGTVASIAVGLRDTVTKGQVLLKFE